MFSCLPPPPVKEELVVHQRIIGAKFQDLLVSPGPGQQAQSGVRELLQHPPEHLVSHPAHVERHPLVELPRLGDYEGVGNWLVLPCRGAQVGIGGVVLSLKRDHLTSPVIEVLHVVIVVLPIACRLARSFLNVVHIL